MDELQAAVLLAKTRHLAAWNAQRARLAARYRAVLSQGPLVLPHDPPRPALAAWHAFVVRTARRDALAAFLRERGVETRVYYPVPLHRQECFASLNEPALPVTEDACRAALALPLFTTMTDEQQGYVLEQIEAFFA
jgi:dTDP-4-amino-4,6-dideoxygalactose transaminase